MGGELWLLMAPGEMQKARTFLEGILEKGHVGELCCEGPDEHGAGCWIEFKGRRIEVGHQAHYWSGRWAMAVACGIRDHFKVVKGGWDDGGYADYFMQTRPFKVDMNMTEAAIQRLGSSSRGMWGKTLADDIIEYKRLRKIYEKATDKMFAPLKAHRKPKPKHIPEKLPKIKIWDITWRKDKTTQGKKTIPVEVAEIKGAEDAKDRFILYTNEKGKKMNMWTLYDARTKTQHWLMHEEATRRVSEVLNGEWDKDGD